METMDYWRLCERLSVVQAALLIIGLEPNKYLNIMTMSAHAHPENFNAVFSALSNAVISKEVKADIHVQKDKSVFEGYFRGYVLDEPDWEKTIISVDDLRSWLKTRGVKKGFFFPQPIETQEYLDPSHKNYAPKLAAAIGAWQAINADPKLIVGKTVKQALQKWLRQNANQFGLTKDDGNPNEQGIEEIAKISNWDAKGGAPKTPG